jgi:hypothetical protein
LPPKPRLACHTAPAQLKQPCLLPASIDWKQCCTSRYRQRNHCPPQCHSLQRATGCLGYPSTRLHDSVQQAWKQHSHCSEPPSSTRLPDHSSTDR